MVAPIKPIGEMTEREREELAVYIADQVTAVLAAGRPHDPPETRSDDTV